MLGKLIKHEFKAVSKTLGILHLALLFITIIGVFTINFNSGSDNLQMISSLTLVMYILILIAVACAVTIYLVVRFYRNLFTDEGYLMNTLPAKPFELILSKLFVGFVWCVINVVCSGISIFFLSLSKTSMDDFTTAWNAISDELVKNGITMGSLIPYFIFGGIISLLYMLVMFYASVAIGQTFKNHKVLFSLGAYVVLYVISQIISSLTLIPFGFFSYLNDYTINMKNTILPIIGLSYVASIALLIVYFVITNYILSRKLNLE
jgi:hypothetical protein